MTRSAYGGSCYLNNAAIAAQRLRERGAARVGIVDIDAHHGNGAQAIFWERNDVFTGSVHVDPATGWFPHFLGGGSRAWCGRRARREPQRASAAGHGRRGLAAGRGRDRPGGTQPRRRGARPRARRRRRERRPGEPARGDAGGLPRGRARSSPTTGSPASSYRKADTISPRSGSSSSRPWKDWMDLDGPIRLSRSRSGSARTSTAASRDPPRVDVSPPPHWRLEAVAATERPRSPAVSPGRPLRRVHPGSRHVRSLAARPRGADRRRRLTTGRDPQPYWEDTQPVFSPDGATVAYADDGWVCVVPTAGGPARRLVEAGSPAWLGNDRLRRLGRARPLRPARRRRGRRGRGRSGSPASTATSTRTATSRAQSSRPTARPSPTSSSPTATTAATRSGSSTSRPGTVRALTGAPGIRDYALDWSPDGATLAVASELSGWFELHLVAADGSGARQLTHADADFLEARWHPDGTPARGDPRQGWPLRPRHGRRRRRCA